jgi:hypothetical protein
MKIRTVLIGMLLAGAAGMSCAQTAEQTAVAYEAGSNDNSPAPQPGACAVNIVGVSDARPAMEGISIDQAVPTGALDGWIASSLDTLKAYGYQVQHTSAPQPGMLNLDVRLIRAYTWLGHMRINGVVALDVAVVDPAGPRSMKFRAGGSKSNMMSAKSEHVTALNYAANSVVDRMAHALTSECSGRRLAQH